MDVIGDAIEECEVIVAILNEKYASSSFCKDELFLAKAKGKKIMPVILPGYRFSDLPNGLQYTLAGTNCVTFKQGAEDTEMMTQVVAALHLLVSDDSDRESLAAIGAPVAVPVNPHGIVSETRSPPVLVQPPRVLGSGLVDLSKEHSFLTPLSYAIPVVIQLASTAEGLKEDAAEFAKVCTDVELMLCSARRV